MGGEWDVSGMWVASVVGCEWVVGGVEWSGVRGEWRRSGVRVEAEGGGDAGAKVAMLVARHTDT